MFATSRAALLVAVVLGAAASAAEASEHHYVLVFGSHWLVPRLGLDRYGIEVVPPQQLPHRRCVLCRCPD